MISNLLSVCRGTDTVGTLRRLEDPSQLVFRYDPAWLASGGPGISFSLPLSETDQPIAQSTFFFANCLPEGYAYTAITLHRHMPQGDVFTFLARHG
ncbi:MAG: HipA N-terminal domain-containing protein [Deltaproteobacteria bacterium]|nr:HipA N-terminal domain-containing protein [Deltaproteobacteria bacterium]